MRKRLALPFLAGLVASILTTEAAAQKQTRREPSAAELTLAKDLLKDAAAEVKAGRCDDALSILKQVAAIKETGESLMLEGDCRKKSDPAGALETYLRAEELAKKDQDKATQQALAARITELSTKVATVTIELPNGIEARVTLDGQEVDPARFGEKLPVAAGEHTIEATVEGKPPFTKTISVGEAEIAVVKIEFASADEGGGAPIGGNEPKPDMEPPKEIPLATWVAGGAAVVLLAGGFIAFAAAGSAASDGEEECKKLLKCNEDSIDSVRQLDAAALGLWLGAAASAGVAIAFYVLETGETKATVGPRPPGAWTRPPGGAAGARAVTRVTLGPGSIGLSGTF